MKCLEDPHPAFVPPCLRGFLFLFGCLLATIAHAQALKEINQQLQFWGSLNTTTRITDRWGMVADFHIRRNHFVADPSFYFVRFGANLWQTDRLTFTFGYAHMWKANDQEDEFLWTNEDRIYQQAQYSSKIAKATMLQRIRNEQRWQEQITTEGRSFSDRVRYLLSFTIPVWRDPAIPSLVLSDEILVQFGAGIAANTFDQNRFFVGIKKNLSPSWSLDFGYMPVYQEKSTGYQYDLNHTIRLFFYFTPDLRKTRSTHESAGDSE